MSQKYMKNLMFYLGLGVFIIYMGYLELKDSISISGIIYLLIGIVFLGMGVINRIKYNRISLLLQLIESGVSSIDELSASTNLSYEKIIHEVNTLIQQGVCTGICINTMTKQIEKTDSVSSSPKIENVTCPNCRATTSTKNGICEFCGTTLS